MSNSALDMHSWSRADNAVTNRRFGNVLTDQRTYDQQSRLLTQTLNTADNRLYRYDGTAFGQTPASEDVDGDGVLTPINLRFPGQYFDKETNLHYNWNSYYDPKVGRYITSDPIGLLGGLNTYAHVGDNPLFWIDPEGLIPPNWAKNNIKSGKAPGVSFRVGGTFGFTDFDFNTSNPSVTSVSETFFPDLGGSVGICFDDPETNNDICDNSTDEANEDKADEDEPTLSFPFRHFGVSFNTKQTCINIGIGVALPNSTTKETEF